MKEISGKPDKDVCKVVIRGALLDTINVLLEEARNTTCSKEDFLEILKEYFYQMYGIDDLTPKDDRRVRVVEKILKDVELKFNLNQPIELDVIVKNAWLFVR